ncbi:MFS transporter [Catenulispora sp. NF23]|uniref:MFS transporter n=1 Tax=Catenulispora pinistramenti TaxID=2705254 RepID=A0ABS5L5M2_9ACTN|nr:MFS transporter [Catenulispora pinistramenti]MBS2538923.1 MFS transporter [Catenulispora pinistramenti]MBS2553643.1 MFS transporter [Catenulispora pinistramenti]
MIDKPHRNKALLVAGCFFMEMLDGTIVTTAAPQMARSLHVSSAAIGLVITSFLLTFAALIPLSGWLTQKWGTRRVFLAAIAVFTLASLGCALSTTLPFLIAMRVLQGLGGAMMVPVGRLIVLGGAEKSDLMRLMSYIVWPGLMAPVLAPLAGGLITTYASWPWLFGINIPLGVVAFGIGWRLIEATPTATPPRLDWVGVVLTCAGLGGLTYAAHLFSDTDISWTAAIATALVSIGLLTAAARHLLRTTAPLVNLRVLRIPTLRASVGGGSLFWIVVGAGPFLLPLLFQNVFGWSAVKSGAVVLFIFVGNIGIKPSTTPLLNRFGFRPVLVGSTLVMALTMAAAGLLTAGTPIVLTCALVLVSGIARSVALTAFTTVAFSDVPPEQMRDANSISATANQLAAGLAIAVSAIALRAGGPLGHLLPGTPDARTAYTVAFLILAVISVCVTGTALRLHPDAGNRVRRAQTAVAVKG